MQYEIYKKISSKNTNMDEWQWKLIKVSSGKALAISAETFKTKEECEKSIHLNMLADYSTPIVEVDEKLKKHFIKEFISNIKAYKPQLPQ